jgi:hypothetical protein
MRADALAATRTGSPFYFPTEDSQSVTFRLFKSTSPDAYFTSDPSCKKVGSLSIGASLQPKTHAAIDCVRA